MLAVEQSGGDDDGSDTAKVVSKVVKSVPVIWRDGISLVEDPYGQVAGPLRAAYRTGVHERWGKQHNYQFITLMPLSAVARGWSDKNMPWTRIEEKPENFIQPKVIKDGYIVKYPEKLDLGAMRKVVQFFLDHQQGKIPYEEGLLFMECGSGSKLHYPTKRPSTHGSFHCLIVLIYILI
jgi:hypothetical protein